MRVLICSRKDFANVGYEMSQALRSIGVEADSFCLSLHAMGYAKHSKVLPWRDIMRKAKDYDVIQFMHSGRDFLFRSKSNRGGLNGDDRLSKSVSDLNAMGKKLVVFHGGTIYRQCSGGVNKIVNPMISTSIIQTPDLLGLGAKNEVLIPAPIDMKAYKSFGKKEVNVNNLVFGHFPSNAAIKGTALIKSVMRDLQTSEGIGKFSLTTSSKMLRHNKNLARVNTCDVYIEHQGFEQLGKQYGACGVAALEAAAMGKVVITSNMQEDVYKDMGMEFGFIASNSREELKSKVKYILGLNKKQIVRLQDRHRRWVGQNFSYNTVGNKLKNLYER